MNQKYSRHNHISIPIGAVKSALVCDCGTPPFIFQFQSVRLKVAMNQKYSRHNHISIPIGAVKSPLTCTALKP